MAATRRTPVGIVHFARTDLSEVLARRWRRALGGRVSARSSRSQGAFLAVPLIAREEVVGVIGVARTTPALIRRHEVELLLLYANTAGLTIERAELYAHLHRSLESLEITDHVSRLFTSRYGQQRTGEEIARCERDGLSFSGLMIGIDGFQEYNDRCGHELGDRSSWRSAKSSKLPCSAAAWVSLRRPPDRCRAAGRLAGSGRRGRRRGPGARASPPFPGPRRTPGPDRSP